MRQFEVMAIWPIFDQLLPFEIYTPNNRNNQLKIFEFYFIKIGRLVQKLPKWPLWVSRHFYNELIKELKLLP